MGFPNFFKARGDLRDEWLFKNSFVGGAHHRYVHALAGELLPTVHGIKRAPDGMTWTAEKMDAPGKWLRAVIQLRSNMGFPKFLLLARKGGEIHQIFDLDRGTFFWFRTPKGD